MPKQVLRPHAEDAYQSELKALQQIDDKPKPTNWNLSPWAVATYILGGQLKDGTTIEPKYYGNRRLIEIAIATLVTDRALLLIGIPGTAKTWLAEHLTAAITGNSKLLVQGSAGLSEDALRYGWNYAQLLTAGPSEKAMVPSPIMHAMQSGKIARIEELTRIPSDVQDTLITILSEKILPVPELNTEIQAQAGFNIIATANDRDKGVNELSSALRRRFNTVVMPLPASLDEEVKIVKNRVSAIGKQLALPETAAPLAEIRRLVTIFRELRAGKTEDGRTKLKTPSSTLSAAEAISVVNNGQSLALHFGDGTLKADDIAAGLSGAIIKDPVQDKIIWQEYLETVMRERKEWEDLYRACKELL
ncbi:MAG: AAA family ATPase [Saprospiraceae bacterium]